MIELARYFLIVFGLFFTSSQFDKMPKPLLNQRNNESSKSSERQKFHADNENTEVFTRKVRITFNDPDATDSSSSSEDEKMETADYENKKSSKSKRFVREVIHYFFTHSGRAVSCEAPPQTKRMMGVSVSTANKTRTRTSSGRKQSSSSPFRGVRRRKYGKWAAEIRDPVKGGRLWLGTYASAEEASHAYEAMRSKFDEILRATTTTICSGKNNNDDESNSTHKHLFLLRKATPISPEAAAPDSEGRGLLSQREFPVSVLDLGIADSNSIQNGKSADHSDKETIGTNNVGQVQIPLDSCFLNEVFESLYIEQHKQQDVFNFVSDEELNEPISSLEELGKYFDRIYCSIDDLKIGGFDDQPTNLPDCDFDHIPICLI